jgi:hypothetical protein
MKNQGRCGGGSSDDNSNNSNINSTRRSRSEWCDVAGMTTDDENINIAEVLVKLQQQNIREVWQLPFVDSFQWDKLDVPIGVVAAIRYELINHAGDSCGGGGSSTSRGSRSKSSRSGGSGSRHYRRRRKDSKCSSKNNNGNIVNNSMACHYDSGHNADCESSIDKNSFCSSSSSVLIPDFNEDRWNPKFEYHQNGSTPLNNRHDGRGCDRRTRRDVVVSVGDTGEDDERYFHDSRGSLMGRNPQTPKPDFRSPISVLEIPIPLTVSGDCKNRSTKTANEKDVHEEKKVRVGAPPPYPGLESPDQSNSQSYVHHHHLRHPHSKHDNQITAKDIMCLHQLHGRIDSPPVPPRRRRSVATTAAELSKSSTSHYQSLLTTLPDDIDDDIIKAGWSRKTS